MRLVINAAFLNETPTGVGTFTREVSNRLCQLNEDTVILAHRDFSPYKVRRTPAGIMGSIKLSNNIRRLIYINTALPLFLRKNRADMLFCPIMEFPFFPRVPMVVTLHDLHPIYFPKQFGLSAVHFKTSVRMLARLASRVVVPSNFVKKELLKYAAYEQENIKVVYEGFDPDFFMPMPMGRKQDFLVKYGLTAPYILFVGSLFPYKNAETLIRSFLEIKSKIPHVLVIIGKRNVAQQPLPEDERVFYLDYVAHEDLPFFYSYAELLVQPSFFEGFGITILEAMACGAPVISSNGGSLPEVVGDAGLLFNPEEGNTLSELILRVINKTELRNDLIDKGFKNVKNFSWDKTAKGILESCKDAMHTD